MKTPPCKKQQIGQTFNKQVNVSREILSVLLQYCYLYCKTYVCLSPTSNAILLSSTNQSELKKPPEGKCFQGPPNLVRRQLLDDSS